MSSSGPRRSARLAHRALASKSCDPYGNKMASVNCISKKFKAVACSSRRKMKIGSIPFLPEGIIFNILVFLPAEILYNVMRLVCQQWYDIINSSEFINAHLQQATTGILIPRWDPDPGVIYFVEMNSCHARVTKSKYEFSSRVCASCDGLVLICDGYLKLNFRVANLTTKQIVTLPEVCLVTFGFYCSALVYVHSIRRYKVFHIFKEFDEGGIYNVFCGVLTLGTETGWRRISAKHIPNAYPYLLESPPLSAGGYLYFTPDYGSPNFLAALDVDTEIIFQLPESKIWGEKGDSFCSFFVIDSFLALMVEGSEFVWEVLVLTELHSGEWTRLYNLDLTCHRRTLNRMVRPHKDLIPCLWLNRELVVFRVWPLGRYIVYSIATRIIVAKFKTGADDRGFRDSYHAHVCSLTWFR